MSLTRVNVDKKRHLAAKLWLNPCVSRVLDIGSGWGGLALHLAKAGAKEVLGITLSKEQLKFSRARAKEAGLADRVRFELCDYRELSGQFDRVVSVGMFEHVGVNHYSEFFAKLKNLMTDDGIAILHSIGADGRARRHQSLDPQIYLSWRLLPSVVRSTAGGRTAAALGHRHRNPAAPLRRHAALMASALCR